MASKFNELLAHWRLPPKWLAKAARAELEARGLGGARAPVQ